MSDRPASAAPAGDGDLHVVFRLGGRLCALPAAAVARLLGMMALSRPPGLPPLLEGMLALGGGVVPVLRPDRLFGLPERRLTPASALVVLRGEPPLALLVDELAAAVPLPPGARLPVSPGATFSDVVAAEAMLPLGPCAVLDPARLLRREEAARIEAFQRMAVARLGLAEGGAP